MLKGMRQAKADKGDLDDQQKLLRALYDRLHRTRTKPTLTLPKQLFTLLDTKECTVVQKKWLMFYCANRGNYVDACVQAYVKIPTYRIWIDPKETSLSNVKFRQAKLDVQEAFTEIGEAKLKEMVASKNSAGVIFFLKNNHPDYKPTVKVVEDARKDKEKGFAKLADVSDKKKSELFNHMMGRVKVNDNEEQTIYENKG